MTQTDEQHSPTSGPLVLHRLTTDYVEAEDRIRVAGATAQGQTVVLWLTLRLLMRLVPQLLRWLDPTLHSKSDVQHWAQQGFAQDAARATLRAETPVVAQVSSPQVRVDAVDLTLTPTRMQMVFRGSGLSSGARLTMDPMALRQWLSIVYERFVQAHWPAQVWPAWMQGQQPQASGAKDDAPRLH